MSTALNTSSVFIVPKNIGFIFTDEKLFTDLADKLSDLLYKYMLHAGGNQNVRRSTSAAYRDISGVPTKRCR